MPPIASPSRLRTLDGVRAIAIALVLRAHLFDHRTFTSWHELHSPGVRIFFVLSGFLVTTLLVRELTRTGAISIARFQTRRLFRLLPPLAAFVLAMAVLGLLGVIELRPGDVVSALSFTTNYHADRSMALGHLWTLALQEQFYLVWPLVFAFGGVRAARRWALGAIALAPVLRTLIWFCWPAHGDAMREWFPTAMDQIAVGCLVALEAPRLAASARWARLVRSPAFALVPTLAFVSNVYEGMPSWGVTLGPTVTGLAFALTLDGLVRNGDGWVGRLLEHRVVVWFGTMSYGIYLWQEPLIFETRLPMAVKVGLTFALAAASHHVIERRMPRIAMKEARAASVI